MRIGIIGNFAQGSYSESLASCLHGPLGQTIFVYPIEYMGATDPFPLSRIINGKVLDYIINIEGHINIHNDINIPVLYYHREVESWKRIDRFEYLAIKFPSMMSNTAIRDFDNKILLQPCTNPSLWKSELPKDLFISQVSRDWDENVYKVSMKIYKNLVQRSQHVIITTKCHGVATRSLEALACNAIPILFVDGLETSYRNMGFNDSNCYFNEIPTHTDLEKIVAGRALLKKHTILERAKQILEVIKNGKE